MPKNPKNRPLESSADEKPSIDGVLDGAVGVLHVGLSYLRREIEAIAAGRGKKSRRDPASRIASLTARVGSIADSLRKVEAARAKRFTDLSPADVLAWLRSLDASERAQFLREVSRIDEARSGLA